MTVQEKLQELIGLAQYVGQYDYILEVNLDEGMDESREEMQQGIDDAQARIDELVTEIVKESGLGKGQTFVIEDYQGYYFTGYVGNNPQFGEREKAQELPKEVALERASIISNNHVLCYATPTNKKGGK